MKVDLTVKIVVHVMHTSEFVKSYRIAFLPIDGMADQFRVEDQLSL